MRTIRMALSLFDVPTKRRLGVAVAGSIVLAFADASVVLLVLPLMQLVLGQDGGALAWAREALGSPSDGTLATLLACAVLVGFIVRAIASIAIRWWTLGFINRESVNSAGRLLRYYLHAPLSLHTSRGTADMLRMINDAQGAVFGSVIAGSMALIADGLTIAIMLITLLVVSPLPTLVVAVYFGVAGYFIQRAIRRSAHRNGDKLMVASYFASRSALHALGAIREIKLRNEQDEFVDDYMHHRLAIGDAGRASAFLNDLPKYVMEILFVLGIGLMTITAYTLDDQNETLATIAIFAAAGFRMLPSAVRVIASVNVVRGGKSALDLVHADLSAAGAFASTNRASSKSVVRTPFRQQLRFECVSFRYPDAVEDVLHDVDFSVPVGSSLALVGLSGSGKSTLVDLMLGLRLPTGGRITVDGIDVTTDLPGWQANLGMVPQDVYLLDHSLRENVEFTLSGGEHDDARLSRVLEAAQLTDVINELPDGVDTQVGDRGSRLSGGQRQRLGIARALYRDPTLLVLDEATSALDNETERRVTKTMERLHGSVTLVVVAHRLSTVRDCDQVIFLDQGKVAATGTFHEVRERSEAFARLVELGSLDHSAAGLEHS